MDPQGVGEAGLKVSNLVQVWISDTKPKAPGGKGAFCFVPGLSFSISTEEFKNHWPDEFSESEPRL